MNRGPAGGGGGPGYGGRGAGGCLTQILWVIVFIAVSVVLMAVLPMLFASSSGGDVTASTYQREPLDRQYVNETDYIKWDTDWAYSLGTGADAQKGMQAFFRATGVQPYLWIATAVDERRDLRWDELEPYLEAEYEAVFSDDGHLIFCFYEPYDGQYEMAMYLGPAAKTVIDAEAQEIIYDYADRYYTYTELNNSQYFGKVFADSAERIMSVTKPWYAGMVIIAAAVLLIVVIIIAATGFIRRRTEEKLADAKILETDIEDL
jgi:hypothetical protein